MVRPIEHQLLAPDGRPLLILNAETPQEGETIQGFVERVNWHFDMPTRCFVDGQVILPSELQTIRIETAREIVIVSRPGMGGGDGKPSTAKTIGSIVAMVALMVLAPQVGTALFGTAAIAGITYSPIVGGVLTTGLRPKEIHP